jgi:hypothetical protein
MLKDMLDGTEKHMVMDTQQKEVIRNFK